MKRLYEQSSDTDDLGHYNYKKKKFGEGTTQVLPTGQEWLRKIYDLFIDRKQAKFRKVSSLDFGVSITALAAAFSGQLDVFAKRFYQLYELFGPNAPQQFHVEEFRKLSLRDIAEQSNCSEEEALDFRTFFEKLAVAQDPWNYKEFLPQAPFYQDSLYSLRLILKDKWNICRERLTGSYQPNELTLELQALKEIVQNLPSPAGFVLTAPHYTLFLTRIRIDSSDHVWILTSLNQLSFKLFDSEKELAESVIATFSTNGRAVLCIETYIQGSNEDREQLRRLFTEFQNNRSLTTRFNYNLIDSSGNCWLLLAAEYEELENIQPLLPSGHDINVDLQNGQGYTALMLAAARDRFEIAALLIIAGAKVDLQNDQGYTALIIAVQNCPNLVQLLIDSGANPNLQTKQGYTALDFAIRKGNFEIVRRLLKHPNINVSWESLEFVETQPGYSEIAKLLWEHLFPETQVNNKENDTYYPAPSWEVNLKRILVICAWDRSNKPLGNISFAQKLYQKLKNTYPNDEVYTTLQGSSEDWEKEKRCNPAFPDIVPYNKYIENYKKNHTTNPDVVIYCPNNVEPLPNFLEKVLLKINKDIPIVILQEYGVSPDNLPNTPSSLLRSGYHYIYRLTTGVFSTTGIFVEEIRANLLNDLEMAVIYGNKRFLKKALTYHSQMTLSGRSVQVQMFSSSTDTEEMGRKFPPVQEVAFSLLFKGFSQVEVKEQDNSNFISEIMSLEDEAYLDASQQGKSISYNINVGFPHFTLKGNKIKTYFKGDTKKFSIEDFNYLDEIRAFNKGKETFQLTLKQIISIIKKDFQPSNTTYTIVQYKPIPHETMLDMIKQSNFVGAGGCQLMSEVFSITPLAQFILEIPSSVAKSLIRLAEKIDEQNPEGKSLSDTMLLICFSKSPNEYDQLATLFRDESIQNKLSLFQKRIREEHNLGKKFIEIFNAAFKGGYSVLKKYRDQISAEIKEIFELRKNSEFFRETH